MSIHPGTALSMGKGPRLLSMPLGFGNGCWDNTPTPVYTYCDANSYKVISKMGFNAVRFLPQLWIAGGR